MELRYMGFDQDLNRRTYRFDGLAKGERTLHFVITADMSLFLKYGVGIQEGPTLCAHKLAGDLEQLREGQHELTDEDLQAYASARSAQEARRAEARRLGVRRRAPGKSD